MDPEGVRRRRQNRLVRRVYQNKVKETYHSKMMIMYIVKNVIGSGLCMAIGRIR